MAELANQAPGSAAQQIDEAKRRKLLELVRGRALARPTDLAEDEVMVWPSLVVVEAVSAVVFLGILTVLSILVNAPLLDRANPNQTPNPSKAPWYFLGLQELLRYFHPQVAGVTIPTVIIIALMATPFVDRNPSTQPDERKLAIVLFSFFLLTFAVLTIIGAFFRGPGFIFVPPWEGGIFFEL